MKTEELLNHIRDNIRRGGLAQATSFITSAAKLRLSRAERLRLARYANETGLPGIAETLLQRFVSSAKNPEPASDDEILEYALALVRRGSYHEAIRLLKTLNTQALPRAANFLAFAYFRTWRWDRAIPILSKTMTDATVPVEDLLMTKLHMSLAQLHGQENFKGAECLAHEVLLATTSAHFRTLHREALGVRMQSQYLQKKWDKALQLLDHIEKLNTDTPNGPISLSHQKWRTLIALNTETDTRANLMKLDQLRARFQLNLTWNELRSCDYYQALATNDLNLAARLYFGTPFHGCREKLLRGLGIAADTLPAHYDYHLGPEPQPGQARFVLDAVSFLKPGQLQQRLLQALVSDFYNPLNMSQLFARLYPQEHYNPLSSHERVSQALKRLRAWLADNRTPIRIDATDGIFRLVSDKPASIRITRSQLDGDPKLEDLKMNHRLTRIHSRFGNDPFRAADVQRLFGVSRSLAVAWLRRGTQEGRVLTLGAGPSTAYSVQPYR